MRNSVERQKFRKELSKNLGNKNLNKSGLKRNKQTSSVETLIVKLDQFLKTSLMKYHIQMIKKEKLIKMKRTYHLWDTIKKNKLLHNWNR